MDKWKAQGWMSSRRWLRPLFKLPTALYHRNLGWMLGQRFVLVIHRGRRSGMPRQTVLEVIRYDPVTRACVVISGYGDRADWYRNLQQTPALLVQIGRDKYVPTQRFLDPAETAWEFRDYRRRHPLVARLALWFFGKGVGQDDATATSRIVVERFRMVTFRPQ